ELAQDVELDRRQVDLLVAAGHAPVGEIDREITHGHERVLALVARPAHHRAQAGQQLLGPERLGDVVVGAHVEGAHLLALVAHGGEHDDRQVAPAAHLGADLHAAAVGQHQVEHHRVGRADRHRVERLGLGLGGVHVVAGVAEDHAQRAQDLRLVVHDEHVLAHACVAGWRTSGKETANEVPSATLSWMRPLLASTKPRQIARPRPEPRPASRPRKNGSNTCARWPAGMPRPRSVTRTVTRPPPAPPLILTGTPGGEWVIAFSSRFANTRSSWAASACTSGSSSGSSMAIGWSPCAERTWATAPDITSRRSVQSVRGFTAPASIFDRSSRSPTMRASRCDSSSITERRSSRSASDSAPSRRPPAAVVMAVSGERKSWETEWRTAVLATSARRVASVSAAWVASRSRSSATS